MPREVPRRRRRRRLPLGGRGEGSAAVRCELHTWCVEGAGAMRSLWDGVT